MDSNRIIQVLPSLKDEMVLFVSQKECEEQYAKEIKMVVTKLEKVEE